jgi:hypothetical protein
LVVFDGGLGDRDSLLWVLMIASAENRAWPGDLSLAQGYEEAGLPAPSLIRTTTIATIERDHPEPLGSLNAERMTIVEQFLGRNLGLEAEKD